VRLVLDTNALVAALRSPSGASAEILRLARRGKIQLLASAALAMEYEAVCLRTQHLMAAGLEPADVGIFLNAVIDLVEPVEIWFLWRPQLRDPGDELVLEAAANGRAAAIVTFNRRDFTPAGERFGLELLTPRDLLTRIES
jgi:putative PIN family toxin of toxin-antitoxin system